MLRGGDRPLSEDLEAKGTSNRILQRCQMVQCLPHPRGTLTIAIVISNNQATNSLRYNHQFSHYSLIDTQLRAAVPTNSRNSVGQLPYPPPPARKHKLKNAWRARGPRLKRPTYVLCLTLSAIHQHVGSPCQISGGPIEKDHGGLAQRNYRSVGLHWWFWRRGK